jgi:hypothetical protein
MFKTGVNPWSVFALLAVSMANAGPPTSSLFLSKEIATHPFVASHARAALIRDKHKRITPGMSPMDVKALLGEPDEVRPLYAPVAMNAKQIGHTYGYVISRASKSGSVDGKSEALVRVSFSLGGYVTASTAGG